MVPEKLNFFRKLLARLGKYYYWRNPKKVNLWLLSSMAYAVTKKYEEIFEGETGMAVDTFTQHFVNGAKAIMFQMQDRVKILYSKSLEDLEFVAKIALYVILGPNWKKFFTEPIYIPAERTETGIAQFRIKFPICALCAGITPGKDIDAEKLHTHSYGELLASALASLLQMVQDYVGNDYQIEIKETKCKLRGDPFGEAVMYFHPKTSE
ncbi:MAG: hypothetical protein ACTSRS_16445 [Candidatus Helarchaeota archaeon]